MIITASREAMPVKTKLYMAMITAARFRFFSLGLANSRFTWANDSSPLMAREGVPKANQEAKEPRSPGKFGPFKKARGFALKRRIGGRRNGRRRPSPPHRVLDRPPQRFDTITVVICITRSALS